MHRAELAEAEKAAVAAIVAAKRAWSAATTLAAQGHDAETIESLVIAGWLEPWTLPLGVSYTLTPWAAERVRVQTMDHWEYVTTLEKEPKAGKKKRRAGVVEELSAVAEHTTKRRRRRIRNAVEVPHWERMPAEDVAGERKPPRVPVQLPQRHRECSMPNWLIEEMEDGGDGPVEQAIAAEKWVMTEKRLDDGRLDVDEESGMPVRVPVVVLPMYARDGGKVKVDPRMSGGGKKTKKAKRRKCG